MSNGPTGVSDTAATAENEPEDKKGPEDQKEQTDGENPASVLQQTAEEPVGGDGEGETAAAETPRRPISPLGRGTSNSEHNLILFNSVNAWTADGWPRCPDWSAQNASMVEWVCVNGRQAWDEVCTLQRP